MSVAALCRKAGRETVGITTAVHGAGGFGKTTVLCVGCAVELPVDIAEVPSGGVAAVLGHC